MTSFLGVPVDAAYHLVSGLTGLLTPGLGGAAAVAAIVLFTVAIRVLLMPLSLRGLRGQAAQARLAPQLRALRRTYAKQPERLQSEMTGLYKREGTSMLAGLTPFLLQWPLLSVMYLLFRSADISGKPNALLSHDLFGVPLGSHWLAGVGPASPHGLVFLAIFVLLAGLSWLTARLARLMAPAAGPAKAGTAGTGTPGAAVSGVPARVLPYAGVVVAAFLPLASCLYLVASTGWALAERALFWRTGRLTPPSPAPQAPVMAVSPRRLRRG